MRFRPRFGSAAFAFLLCLLRVSAAQAPAGVPLTGTVTDPSGAKVGRAQVHVQGRTPATDSATQPAPFAQDVAADGSGNYTIAVPAGEYDVVVSAPGFDPFVRSVTVADKPMRLDAKLVIATQAEQVDVAADSGASTAAADNRSALVFKGDQLDSFSHDDTTFQQQIQALGGGPDGAQIYVDGFSGGSFPPRESIREIRINQNPYSSQYDSLGFGRFEIFTKPGSDTLHGDGFIGGSGEPLNAPNPYSGTPPPYHSLIFRGSLSGPLGKKTSFFVNSNERQDQSTAVVNATTLDAVTFAPVALSQSLPSPQSSNQTDVRIDRQINANNTLVSRYEFDTTHQQNGGVGLLVLPSEGITSETKTQTLQMGNTQLIGAKIVNETRFQYIRTRTDQTSNSNAPTVVVEGAFNGGGSPAQAQRDNQDRYEFQEYLSFALGKHFVRAGARYRTVRDANVSTANYNGQYIFSGNTPAATGATFAVSPLNSTALLSYQITQQGLAAGQTDAQIRATCKTTSTGLVACGGASQFSLTAGQSAAVLVSGDVGLYAEDEWKVTKNVTLDYGMRFESQSAVPDHFDPAPRVGAAWAVGQTDKRQPFVTLRAGAGLFYNRFTATNLLTSIRQNGVTQQSYFVTNPAFYPALPSAATLSGKAPTPYTVSPNLRTNYTIIGGLTAERGIGKIGNVSANFLSQRFVHLYNSFNVNAPLPGSGVRPLGGTGDVYQFASEGQGQTERLFVNANLHPGKFFLFLNYNYTHTNQDANSANSFPSQPYNLKADFGPGVAGFRSSGQRLFAGGGGQLPYGFRAFLFLSAQTGSPFDITTGSDLNGDSIYNDRPAFATDLSRASVVKTSYGNFDTVPIAGQTLVPQGYARAPGLFYAEVNLGKEFKFGPRPDVPAPPPNAPPAKGPVPRPDPRYTLAFTLEADNVLNHVNPGVPVGVLSSPAFGKSISTNQFFSNNAAANRVLFLYTYFRF